MRALPDECASEPTAFLPSIIVELLLECGHPLHIFWQPESPDDRMRYSGERNH